MNVKHYLPSLVMTAAGGLPVVFCLSARTPSDLRASYGVNALAWTDSSPRGFLALTRFQRRRV